MPARRRKKAKRVRKTAHIAPYVVTHPDPPESVLALAREGLNVRDVKVACGMGVIMTKDHKYAIQHFLIDGEVLAIITER